MAVKIKLKRLGKIREPYYRIVVADARTKRDGRAIEEIGKYHPKADPSVIEVDSERVQHWLSVGAQPTDPVRHLLTITGDWQKFKGEPGAEGTLKTAEPKADRKERYESLVKESLAAKETAKETKAASRPARSTAKKDQPKKADAAAAAPAEAKADTKAETKPEAKAETKAETKPEAKAETKPETKAETKPEAKAETKAETKPETKSGAKAETKAEPDAAEAPAEAPDGGSGA